MKLFSIANFILGGMTAVLISSCQMINEDFPACPESPGAEFQFKYDYNIDLRDKLTESVHCITVYVFDERGLLAGSVSNAGNTLISTGYKTKMNLPAGRYHAVAYGGMACNKASFHHPIAVYKGMDFDLLETQINDECISPMKPASALHDLFFGSADFETDGKDVIPVTISFVRDTNHLGLTLRSSDSSDIALSRYSFSLTDANSKLDNANNLSSTKVISYLPYSVYRVNNSSVKADFSTSRIYADKSVKPLITVTDNETGETVLTISPLSYMFLYKDTFVKYNMSDQEYLDRASDWEFVFYMNPDGTPDLSRIIINGWETNI